MVHDGCGHHYKPRPLCGHGQRMKRPDPHMRRQLRQLPQDHKQHQQPHPLSLLTTSQTSSRMWRLRYQMHHILQFHRDCLMSSQYSKRLRRSLRPATHSPPAGSIPIERCHPTECMHRLRHPQQTKQPPSSGILSHCNTSQHIMWVQALYQRYNSKASRSLIASSRSPTLISCALPC